LRVRTITEKEIFEFIETGFEYVCAVGRTPETISELIENGFEYVCDQDDLKFFRKRK